MKVAARQDRLITILNKADRPVSGSELAEALDVSRQIIVKDINTIKEKGVTILSTPKGYLIDKTVGIRKIFKVQHTVDEIEKELNIFVDYGVEVEDVFIFHKVYNELHAKICIRTRMDVKDFVERFKNGISSPLMTTTNNYHYHTVIAKDPGSLRKVARALKDAGYLVELTEFEPEGVINPNLV